MRKNKHAKIEKGKKEEEITKVECGNDQRFISLLEYDPPPHPDQ